MPSPLQKLPQAIVITGLLAGILDGAAAVISFILKTGKDPAIVFKYIASAVFGRAAYSTPGMVGLGVLFHFAIAFIFTAIFFFLYPRVSWVGKNKILAGILYGLIVWVVMNRIVVPVSFAAQPSFVLKDAIISMLILICFIGLPVSLMANKHYLYKK